MKSCVQTRCVFKTGAPLLVLHRSEINVAPATQGSSNPYRLAGARKRRCALLFACARQSALCLTGSAEKRKEEKGSRGWGVAIRFLCGSAGERPIGLAKCGEAGGITQQISPGPPLVLPVDVFWTRCPAEGSDRAFPSPEGNARGLYVCGRK
jgi:hypothetical protein